ncbi:MAG: hypothetical protein ACR2OH_07265 [Microthrixaceae bacterium]
MKIFLAVAALVVVVALLGGTDSLDQGADAQVDITLMRSINVENARDELISSASRTWQATRVAESTEDGSATVEFSMPGSSLDGFVAELRDLDSADDVEVKLEVDPDQLEPDALASDEGSAAAAQPVRVEVNLDSTSPGGAWLTIGGAILVAAMALIALVVVQRRFSGDDPYSEGADEPGASI